MANISIGGRLSLLQRVASLDLRYGPYSSITDAYENMGPSGDEVITAGLPFGVTEADGSVSIYIWTKGEDATINDCKKLDKEHIILFNGFIDISVSIKQQSYNNIATKDNIVFLNDRKQFAYRDGLNFYINWKNRYVWSNENLVPYDDVIYIDINDNKAYYYNGTTLTLLASEAFVSSINNQAPDENGNVNITKEHIGLENVDNTADEDKVVKGASEDGSGNVITTTYETKSDATTKQTTLQGAINALQTSVAALTGLDSTNFGGFSIESTEADAISNIATLYTADGYTDELLWYMAGTSLSSVKAYRYNGSGTPTAISSDSYDCLDFSGLIADVSTLSQNLAALRLEMGEPQAIPLGGSMQMIDLNIGIGNTVNLTPASSYSYSYSIADIEEGDILIINGTGGTIPRLWGIIDSQNKLLDVANDSITANNLRLIAPTNAAKVIIHDKTNKTSYVIKMSPKTMVRIIDIVNDLITGGTNVVLSAEMGKTINNSIKQIGVKSAVNTDCDFSIGDESGNILVKFKDGHVKTKNFDSSSINERVEELEDAEISITDTTKGDFNIGDDNGNILLQLKDGHIKTKNFDSSKIQNSRLQGKTFSILGDSISTYQGYLVSDESGYDGSAYAYYYPRYGVDDVSKTWWKKLEALSGMQLLHNCAWSGSQVAGNSTSTTSASVGCSNRRIADLGRNNTTPDIILILIGVNDLRNRDYHLLGDWTANDELPAEGSVTTFSAAYALMVSKVLTAYPTSEVYCCTILDTGNSGWDTHDATKYPCKNDGGNTTYQWNEKIKEVANGLGANILDMHSCGINYFNLNQYTGDRLHPNANGTTLMAKKAYSELLNKTKL